MKTRELITNNQGDYGPLTNNQGAPNQQPGSPGPLTGNQRPPKPLTDDQGSWARGPLTQIFYSSYAKLLQDLKVLS